MQWREGNFISRAFLLIEEKELRNSSGKEMTRLKTWALFSINLTWGLGHDSNLIVVSQEACPGSDGC